MSTLISDIMRDRMERGLADLLLSVYDCGYCHGAGIAMESPAHAGLAALLTTIAQRHAAEVLALQQWADAPLLRDEIPGWLLGERDVIEPLDDDWGTMEEGWLV